MNAKITLVAILMGLALFEAFLTWAFSVFCGWTVQTWIVLSICTVAMAAMLIRSPRLFRWLVAHQLKTEELLRQSKP